MFLRTVRALRCIAAAAAYSRLRVYDNIIIITRVLLYPRGEKILIIIRVRLREY